MASNHSHHNDSNDSREFLKSLPPHVQQYFEESTPSLPSMYFERHEAPLPIAYSSPILEPEFDVDDYIVSEENEDRPNFLLKGTSNVSGLKIFEDEAQHSSPMHVPISSRSEVRGLDFMPPLPGLQIPTNDQNSADIKEMEQVLTKLKDFRDSIKSEQNIQNEGPITFSLFAENNNGIGSNTISNQIQGQSLQLSSHDFEYIINVMNKCKSGYQNAQNEIQNLRGKCEGLEQVNWQLKDKILDLEKSKDVLEERLVLARSSLSDVRQDMASMSKQLKNPSNDDQFTYLKQSENEAKITELEEKIISLEQEKENLATELGNVIKASDKMKYVMHNKSSGSHHENNEAYKLENESLRKSIEFLEEENRELSKEMNLSILKQDSYYQQMNHYKDRKESLEKELKELKIQFEPENKIRISLSERNEFLEVENKDLVNQVEVLKNQREAELRKLLNSNTYQSMYAQNQLLKKDIEDLNIRHGELDSQHRSTSNKIKVLENKLNKAEQNYDNLVRQDQSLTSKQKELQESNKNLQDEITGMFNLKNELLKQRRTLGMEVGSLKTIIASNGIKSFRTLPARSNFFQEQNETQPRNTRQAPIKQRKSIALINDDFNQNYNQFPENEVEDNNYLSDQSIPSLSYLGENYDNPIVDQSNIGGLGKKLDSAKSRAIELENLIQKLHHSLDIKEKALRSENYSIDSSYTTSQSTLNGNTTENNKKSPQNKNHSLKENELYIQKIDDLNNALTTHTQEFYQLIEAEKKTYFVTLEKEDLSKELANKVKELDESYLEIEKLKSQLQKTRELLSEKEDIMKSKDGFTPNEEYAKLSFKNMALNKEISDLKFKLENNRYLNNNPSASSSTDNNDEIKELKSQLEVVESELKAMQAKMELNKSRGLKLREKNNDLTTNLEKESNENKILANKLEDYKMKLINELKMNKLLVRELEGIRMKSNNSESKYEGDNTKKSNTFQELSTSNQSDDGELQHRGEMYKDEKLWQDLMELLKSSENICKIQIKLMKATKFGPDLASFERKFYRLLNKLKSNGQSSLIIYNTIYPNTINTPNLSSNSKSSSSIGSPKSSFNNKSILPPETIPNENIFSYKKPYKEICYQFRNENKHLKERLAREIHFRYELAFQKRYLNLVIWELEKGKLKTLKLIDNMGLPVDREQSKMVHVKVKPQPYIQNSDTISHDILAPKFRQAFSGFTQNTCENRKALRRCVYIILFQMRVKRKASVWQTTLNRYNTELSLFDKYYQTLVAPN